MPRPQTTPKARAESPRARTIPAFAPAAGGDDLEAARRFVEGAVDRMRTLRADDTPAVHSWLDDVGVGARGLQARAIARAAENARKLESPRALGSALHTVATLIAQYEQGLVDVEAQLETIARAPLPVLGTVNAVPQVAVPQVAGFGDRTARDKFDVARETLMGLLPTVDAGGHEAALLTLVEMEFGPGAEAEAEVADDVVADDVVAEIPLAVESDLPAFDVEPLLPGLVDHAHRTAARAGKKLTASYAARDARLVPGLAPLWQAAVETAVNALVETTLETPDARQARGETAAAHMAFTVEGSDEGLTLLIRCPGHRLPRFAVDAPHSLDMRVEDGVVMLRFLARAA